MSGKNVVSNDMLFFAFRYALGRSTYAPSTVQENIKQNLSNISTSELESYVKEIEEANFLGQQVDVKGWLDFKDFLQNEASSRSS